MKKSRSRPEKNTDWIIFLSDEKMMLIVTKKSRLKMNISSDRIVIPLKHHDKNTTKLSEKVRSGF